MVRVHPRAVGELQHGGVESDRGALRPKLDPRLGEQIADDLRSAVAEQLQWPPLVGRHRNLHGRHTAGT